MVDLAPTPANVIAVDGSPTRRILGGETIVAGEAVYEDGANGLKLAQANAIATAGMVGIALNGGDDGQPIEVITGGNYNPGAVVVVGETYVLSAVVAGNIAPIGDLASTNSPTILGVATTTSNIKLSINISGVLKP
jgi:hypothetical protein